MKKNVIFAEDSLNLEIFLKLCVMVVITKIGCKIIRKEKLKFLSEISYLRNRVNQLTEFFNPNMLRDIVFLCHPDRNANSERSRKVSAWLNNLREKINEE